MGTPTKIINFPEIYDFSKGSHCKSAKNNFRLQKNPSRKIQIKISPRKNNIFHPDFFLSSTSDVLLTERKGFTPFPSI